MIEKYKLSENSQGSGKNGVIDKVREKLETLKTKISPNKQSLF